MTTALANRQGQLAPLSKVDPKEVLDRYLAGETSPQIAQALGVTKQALSHWLSNVAESEWKSAQFVKAHNRKEEAEELIETASNPLDLARAREKLRAAQWDLERVCRRIYGQDAAQTVAQAVQININLRNNGAAHQAEVVTELPKD
jgi:transcriptional regulator with XRE-family HTH domain